MYYCYLDEYDNYFESENIYDSWVVDECMERLFKCENHTQKEIDDILAEHPEYSIKTLPRYY